MEKRLLLIMNPMAGQKKAARYLANILCLFGQHGFDCTVHMTRALGDGREVARLRAGEFSLVVCIGGDGTLNEVLDGLLASGANTPIGYIPAGSTNDFASSLGLPRDMVQAAREIVTGQPTALDVGKFNGRVFSYVASCGAFTKASYSTPQTTKNVLGHLAYILEGIKDLGSLRRETLRVESGSTVLEGDFIFAAVSNSTSLGGVLTLDKSRVSMSDGKLELFLVRYPENWMELSRIVGAVQGHRYDDPGLTFLPIETATITSDVPVAWTLDGEFGGNCTKVSVQVCPGAVSWMLRQKP